VRNFVLVNNLLNIIEIVNRKSKIVCQVALGIERKARSCAFGRSEDLQRKARPPFRRERPTKILAGPKKLQNDI
jgi:hypothetical protein